MTPRTDLLAIFSTFIELTGGRFSGWVSDQRLARRMQQRLEHEPGDSEQLWVIYWYQHWRQSRQAKQHLWAYLQEPCYWAADKITQRFSTVQYTLADGFQLAIAQADRILNGYDPSYGSQLKAYARIAFGNIIRDWLRQTQEVNISSDWGLLRRLSQTKLNQALQAMGFVQTDSLILAWQCFKAICTPTPNKSVRKLSAPTPDQLVQIAQRYNHLRHQLSPSPAAIDTLWLETELPLLAAAARTYLTPPVTSLNQLQHEDSNTEQLDTLFTNDTPMAQLLTAEADAKHQWHLKQLGIALEKAVTALDAPNQQLLQLYYQRALTQTEIASQLTIEQYQVSRQLKRIRQKLLLSVVKWSHETLHTPSNSAVLSNVSDVIHEWLQRYYQPDPPEALE